jgi:hypothetical protein
LHEADGICQTPVTAADDQFVPVEPDFVDEQSQIRFAQARRAIGETLSNSLMQNGEIQ